MIRNTARRLWDWLRPSRPQSRKHQWHENLTDEANAFLEDLQSRRRIDIAACRKGEILHVVAGRHYYDLIIVDPKRNEIAVVTDCEGFPKDELWRLDGSRLGEESLCMHTIVAGCEVVLRGLRKGILETERVDSITIREDAKRAQDIIKRSEANRPRKETAAEQIAARRRLTEWASEVIIRFPADERPSIQRIADRYHDPAAKRVVLDILCQSAESHKLQLAITLLERDWDRYWSYKAPEQINPFGTSLNHERWKALYDELEIEGEMYPRS